MKLIALSGGIASGKSTIARRLASHGAVHIDADHLAREAVEPESAALRRIEESFGSEVIANDGSLDRAALGRLVFDDPQALAALNSIVHPEVRKLAQQRLDAAEEADPEAVVVYDVPLLIEAGVQLPWDLIVIAEAPAEVRAQRMVRLRGMTDEEAKQRIATQATDEARREIADVIIDTSGSEADTLKQADSLWERLRTGT